MGAACEGSCEDTDFHSKVEGSPLQILSRGMAPFHFILKAKHGIREPRQGTIVQIPVKDDSALGPEGNGHDRGGKRWLDALCAFWKLLVPCAYIQVAVTKLYCELLL